MNLSLCPDISVTEVDDGLILLDQRNGRYWHLNGTAGRMLKDLLDGHSPEETAARIAGSGPAAGSGANGFREQVTADVRSFVDGLRRAKLVIASGARAASETRPA